MNYNHILDSVEELPIKQQIQLVEIIKKRIIEKKRENILKNFQDSILEFDSSQLEEESASEFINRINA